MTDPKHDGRDDIVTWTLGRGVTTVDLSLAAPPGTAPGAVAVIDARVVVHEGRPVLVVSARAGATP